MQLQRRTVGDVTVIALDGRLDSGSAPAVQADLQPLIAGQSRVLLDLRQVSYLSSAGLRVLLLMYRQSQREGGRVAVADVAPEVRAVLTATGFISFFTVADTVEDGVKALTA